MKNSAETNVDIHQKTKERLKLVSSNLIANYQNANNSIRRIEELGWNDKWFFDLKKEVFKASNHILELKEFMDNAIFYQEKIKNIVLKYKQLTIPEFKY